MARDEEFVVVNRKRFPLPSFLPPAIVGACTGAFIFLVILDRMPATPEVSEHEAQVVEVYRLLKLHYVEEINEEDLATSAIDGMFRELDLQSDHYLGEAVEDLHSHAASQYGGIGIVATRDESGHLRVLSVEPGKPADRAGIDPGDLITTVNSVPAVQQTTQAVLENIRGQVGKPVHVTVLRSGTTIPLSMSLVRVPISPDSVHMRVIDPSLGILRISEFRENTAQLAREALESTGELAGLMIDLRGNPGGMLDSVVDVADLLLDSGKIVHLESRDGQIASEHNATEGQLLTSASMVILIDRDTASAAELLAGVLQDHERATVVGHRSLGKGTVQSVMRVGERRAIKLTTAKYVLPLGRTIEGAGVMPDVVAAPTERQGLAVLKSMVRERVGQEP